MKILNRYKISLGLIWGLGISIKFWKQDHDQLLHHKYFNIEILIIALTIKIKWLN
tara:strand:+ start:220 stop:384 length:165 start_codon:yes stop_codon:yes gene_type:complete